MSQWANEPTHLTLQSVVGGQIQIFLTH